jgi:phosphoglycolate phosphatase
MKKILVFDLDGTLLDSLPDIQWALNTTLAEYGLPGHDLAQVGRMVGHGLSNLVQLAVPESHRRPEQVKPMVAHIKELYASVPFKATVPYPGLPQLMAELKATDHVMGVLTNKAEPIAQKIVPHFFPGIFDHVQGERPDLPRKPDPEALLILLRRLAPLAGIDPADEATLKRSVVLTGDSEADIQTASRGGMTAIGVAWGYRSPEDLLAAGAATIVSDADGLRRAIAAQEALP